MNAGSPRLQRAFRRAQPWVVHDNPELVLHSDDREGPTFGTMDKIKFKNGKITARDFGGIEYELELLERINVDREIMNAVDNAEAA